MNDSDCSQIIALWKICFGDSESFIQRFLYDPSEEQFEMVYRVDNQIVSMLFLLPTELIVKKQSVFINYVYACGTHPDFRGQGLMRQLLEKAAEKTKNDGKTALFLVPATPELFGFYEQFGFKHFSNRNLEIIKKPTLPCNVLRQKNLTNEQIWNLRNRYLSKFDYIKWSVSRIDFLINDFQKDNGVVLGFETDFGDGYALCRLNNRLLEVVEWMFPEEVSKNQIFTTILNYFEMDVCQAISMPYSQNGTPFSMIRIVDDHFPKSTDVYVNLVGF